MAGLIFPPSACKLWHCWICGTFSSAAGSSSDLFSSFPLFWLLALCSSLVHCFLSSVAILNRNLGLVSGTEEVWESGFVPFLSSHLKSQLSTCFFSPCAMLSVCRFKPWYSSDLCLPGVHSWLYWKNTLSPNNVRAFSCRILTFYFRKMLLPLSQAKFSRCTPLCEDNPVMLGMN